MKNSHLRRAVVIALIGLGLSACTNNGLTEPTASPSVDESSTTQVTAPGPLSAGRLLASQCAQCHGTDGVSMTEIDSLAGESRHEIVEEMLEMQRDNDNDLMVFQAHGYTNEQIGLIADYFSQLDRQSNHDEEDD